MTYQVMPDLAPSEYEELKADIAARGVMVPVEYDEHGAILDGHHRVRICQELGIDAWPRLIRPGLSEEEKRAHARALNLARRHLTQEQRRGLIREQLKDTPEQSDRQIARALGVSHHTVNGQRETLERRGQIAHVSARTDTLGRKQPRTKKPRKLQPVFVSTETAEKAQALPEERRGAVVRGEIKLTEAQRQTRNAEKVARVSALPTGQYHVIYADPPWQYNDKRATGDHRESTGAEHHYPTMTLDELKALPVKQLAAPDCVLFMWATFPLLPEALELTSAWGLAYKTAFVWDKGGGAFGHYHNAAAELLLVCTRGSGTPQAVKREDQVQAFERSGHSRKPEAWRELIDRLYPVGPRVELFRRGDVPAGWETWGAEAEEAE